MYCKSFKHILKGGALIGALLVVGSMPVLAYDQNNTHPALTDEIVDFYNLNFPDKKLNNEEKQWLIQGSIDEDNNLRSVFHFYDPVHDKGIQSVYTAGLPMASSKKWALADNIQRNFYNSQQTGLAALSNAPSAHDFSYQRAIDDYSKGDRKRAFFAFGHVLHLLEDAGVPDHTRNDAHPAFIHGEESPYEAAMAKWDQKNFSIAGVLFKNKEKPAIFYTMESYFDRVANYSNGYFYSKDTVNSTEYKNPKISKTENSPWKDTKGGTISYVSTRDKDLSDIKLAFAKVRFIGSTLEITDKSLTITVNKEIKKEILDGYWEKLSKEIVLNGAGALNLFLNEAERAKEEYARKPKEKMSLWAQLLGLVGIGDPTLTTSDGQGTSDVVNPTEGLVTDTNNDGDTNLLPLVSPKLSPSPSLSPSVSPKITPKSSPTPKPSATPKATPKPSTSPTPKPVAEKKGKTSGKVVINEVAWAGTEASIADEWIELYNTEDYDVDLSGWTLKAEDGTPDIAIEEGKIIKAQSYFLLERTNDTTVNTIPSDQIYTGALGNEGEFLRLTDTAGTVVDTVGSSGGAWPAGSSAGKISMEKTASGGWKNFGGNPSAKDANGNFINGTPRAANSTTVMTFSSGGGGGGSSSSPTPTPTPTPSPSVTPTPSPTPGPTEKININTASKEQLITLPGIGEVKSQAIIDYRTTNGPFAKIEDIQNVSGIGPVTFNNIKDLITVGNTVLNPSVITNLAAAHNSPTITATWTAPDPGDYPIASLSYDLRYSSTIFSEAASASWWSAASVVASSSLPAVGEEGASQSASFDIISYDQKWYFALKTGLSDISNIATVSFPTAIDDSAWAMFGKDQYHTSLANVAGPAGPSPTVSEFTIGPDDPLSEFDNVFRSEQISAPCGNGGDSIRIYDHAQNSQGAFPCAGGGGTWSGYFNTSFNDTIFTQFEQVGTLPCGTFDECKIKPTTLSIRQVVLRADGWTPPPTWSGGQPVADADGNIYFGATDGSSYKLVKLNKNGVKQWEYASNVSIGTPAVLSDGVVYFGRIGAGGVLAFTALNEDGSKKWDYDNASTVQSVTVSSKGEPHFTYSSGADKLTILNTDGSEKITSISASGLAGFAPVILDSGTIITASKVSGNQFVTAYSSEGTQLWQVFYTGANGNTPANPSYDQATGKTYSAAGSKIFNIPSDGSVLNASLIDFSGIAATMVAITPTKLLVGFDYTWSAPASGSKLFALNKSDLTTSWSFQAEGKINSQIAVDQDGNAYFSTQSGHLYSVDANGSQNWHISVGANSTISPILVENGLVWGYGSKIVLIN